MSNHNRVTRKAISDLEQLYGKVSKKEKKNHNKNQNRKPNKISTKIRLNAHEMMEQKRFAIDSEDEHKNKRLNG